MKTMTEKDLSKCHNWILSINISAIYISLGLLISLQPPFFPSEAEKMGATPSEYGFVFGVANLSLFIFSPIFGKIGPFIGAKKCFNMGALIQGVSGFLFAFLPYFETKEAFIGCAYLLRFLEGLGTSMAWSSALSILMKIFPQKVAQIMSWTQTCFGLGFMLGPGVGAYLYSVGGFMLPFLTIGSVSIILSVMLIFTIPDLKEDLNDIPSFSLGIKRTRTANFSMILPFIDLFAAMCGSGMLESMLEPHMEHSAQASTFDIGITFLLFGCCYMVGNIIFGAAMDKIGCAIYFSICGNLIYFMTFMLVGPLPMFSFRPTVALIQAMMAITGFGYSCVVVSSFSRAHEHVLKLGFADDISTHMLISGLWLSAFSLGNFVGPTVAGCLVQKEGFRITTLVFFSLFNAMIAIDSFEAYYNRKDIGYQPLQ